MKKVYKWNTKEEAKQAFKELLKEKVNLSRFSPCGLLTPGCRVSAGLAVRSLDCSARSPVSRRARFTAPRSTLSWQPLSLASLAWNTKSFWFRRDRGVFLWKRSPSPPLSGQILIPSRLP